MSRYKVTNSKSYGVLSGSKWHCHIYDRKDEIEYIGTGISKKEASDNAWDEVWYKKKKTNLQQYGIFK